MNASEVAVEQQSKFDYFFAAAILASLGFSAQLSVDTNKLTVTAYVVGLLAFAFSAVCSIYRLQQKPLIYKLHANADLAANLGSKEFVEKINAKANGLERQYEIAYIVMCICFGVGAIAIGVTRVAKPLLIAFCS